VERSDGAAVRDDAGKVVASIGRDDAEDICPNRRSILVQDKLQIKIALEDGVVVVGDQ
jgi:hypothetical protein